MMMMMKMNHDDDDDDNDDYEDERRRRRRRRSRRRKEGDDDNNIEGDTISAKQLLYVQPLSQYSNPNIPLTNTIALYHVLSLF